MTVHVRHGLVHEGRVAHGRLVDDDFVFRLVQIVDDGRLAQNHRLSVLVGKVIGIEQFAGFRVVHVKLACNEGVVQFEDVGAPRLVGKDCNAENKTLGLVVNLPGALIAEFTADKTGVTVGLVVVDLLAEPQGRCREGVAEMLSQNLNGCGHHTPVVFASEQPLGGGCSVVELDAGVENRGVSDVFLCLLAWKRHAALFFGKEEGHSLLIDLVVALDPALKPSLCAAGVNFLDFVFSMLG